MRIEKSETIKAGLRAGFQSGHSKMAARKCYGYDSGSDGKLMINQEEAAVVAWIFQWYLAGGSLGKIAAGLEKQNIASPTGKPKWNREAIDKLLSNEKYIGQVLLRCHVREIIFLAEALRYTRQHFLVTIVRST